MYDENQGGAMILVDPAFQASWKSPIYYSTIKLLAVARLENQGRTTLVKAGASRIVVLPDRDEKLPAGNYSSFRVVTNTTTLGSSYKILLD